MATEAEIKAALVAADKAGDTEAVKVLIGALKRTEISAGESAVKGVGQGATLGFGDELSGVVSGAMDKLMFPELYKDQSFKERYIVRRDQRRAENQAAQEANPVAYGASELLGGAGVTAGVGSAATSVSRLAGLGGGIGAAGGAGYSTADDVAGLAADTALGAGLGGVAGAALPAAAAGLRRAGSFKHRMPPSTGQYAQSAQALKDAGIDLTTGQELGANWVKALENSLAEVPIGGKPMQRMMENQRLQYQKSLLKMVGLDDGSDLITSATLKKARDNISRSYTRALKNKKVDIEDDAFLDALADIEDYHLQVLPSMQKRQVTEIITDLLDRAGKDGVISGPQYQRMRSFLGKRARGTGDHAGLYGDLQRALDDAFVRAAGTGKKEIDKQFARLKQLEKIVNSAGGPEVSEGILSPVRLAREAAGSPGGTDWQDFTRAAATVLPDRVGNSGTAQRNYMMNVLTGGGMLLDPVTIGSSVAASRALSNQLARGRGVNVLALPQFRVPQVRTAAPAAIPAPLMAE